MQNLPRPNACFAGVLRKLVALALAALFFVLALSFSLLLLALLFIAGAAAWGYFWWKTRRLRKQMRAYPRDGFGGTVFEGEVIEAEVIRVADSGEGRPRPHIGD